MPNFDHQRLALLLRHRHPLTLRLIDVFPDGVDHHSETFHLLSPLHCDLTLADLLPPPGQADAGPYTGNHVNSATLRVFFFFFSFFFLFFFCSIIYLNGGGDIKDFCNI
jgi:hypothetical protein